MYTIQNGFINARNQHFDNIRNINFAKKSDLFGGVGIPITETQYEENPWIDDEFRLTNGIYLYQSYYDSKKALRIYKDYADYPYLFHNDDKLVSELQRRQNKITKVEFPTGIVTLGECVIGQEVPFYDKYQQIVSAFLNNTIYESPAYYYLKITEILKELHENGITYSDVHAKNFLVNSDNDIRIIDFEDRYIGFDQGKEGLYCNMISNLHIMLDSLSKIVNFPLESNFFKTRTLEEVEESLNESYVLSKRLGK